MNIETERLIIRPLEEKDRDAHAQLHASAEVKQYFPKTMNREEADASFDRAQAALRRHGFHFIATELKQTNEFVGILGIGRFSDEISAAVPSHPGVEIGWQFLPKFWGKGYATEGAIACLDYGWNVARLAEIVAIAHQENVASHRVMEKIGMHRDTEGNFSHPDVPPGHSLRPHVLYRIGNPN